MYRVELKVKVYCLSSKPLEIVPNVPCGVESTFDSSSRYWSIRCMFLMYRVELKAASAQFILTSTPDYVPNVPCGVESHAHTCNLL